MIAAYGAPTMPGEPLDPKEWVQRLAELRRDLAPYAPPQPATKADLDAAVARIESQMLALYAEVKRLADAAKPKRRRSKRGGR